MPVDRSISGIRVAGRADKHRPTTRFPVQIPSRMNHRRPSRTDAWRQKRRTQQVGRVRPQLTEAAPTPLSPEWETRPAGRTTRKPARSLTIALLLAAATVTGAGVAAWAMGATPVPAGTPEQGTGTLEQGTEGLEQGSPSTAASLQPDNGADRPLTADSTGAATLSTALPGPSGAAQARSMSVDGPALVSALAPGDPGFGWPSSAFGSGPP